MQTFYASLRDQAVGANKRYFHVFNATGSGRVIRVYRLKVIGSPQAAISGVKINFAAVRLTTQPSDGAAMTLAKADTTSTNPPAQILVRSGHTTGSIEAQAFAIAECNPEETSPANNDFLYDAPIDGSEAVLLREGEGFEVRQGSVAGAGHVSIQATIGIGTDPLAP